MRGGCLVKRVGKSLGRVHADGKMYGSASWTAFLLGPGILAFGCAMDSWGEEMYGMRLYVQPRKIVDCTSLETASSNLATTATDNTRNHLGIPQ